MFVPSKRNERQLLKDLFHDGEDDVNDENDGGDNQHGDDSSCISLLSCRTDFFEEYDQENLLNRHFQFRNMLLDRLSNQEGYKDLKKTKEQMNLLYEQEEKLRNDIMKLVSISSSFASSSSASSSFAKQNGVDEIDEKDNFDTSKNHKNKEEEGENASDGKGGISVEKEVENEEQESIKSDKVGISCSINNHQSGNTATVSTATTVKATKATTANYASLFIYKQLLFDIKYALPGCIAMIFHCAGHSALYSFLETIVMEGVKLCSNEDNEDYVIRDINMIILLVGLLLARLSGCLWYWLSDEKFLDIKQHMETSNKKHKDASSIVFRPWGVRLLRWFRNHKRIRNIFDGLSLYMIYMSVYHFTQVSMQQYLLDQKHEIIPNVPSIKAHINTTLSQILIPSLEESSDYSTTNTSSVSLLQTSFSPENNGSCADVPSDEGESLIWGNTFKVFNGVKSFVLGDDDNSINSIENTVTTDETDTRVCSDEEYFLKMDYEYLYSRITAESYERLLAYDEVHFVPPLRLLLFDIILIVVSSYAFTKMTPYDFWTF